MSSSSPLTRTLLLASAAATAAALGLYAFISYYQKSHTTSTSTKPKSCCSSKTTSTSTSTETISLPSTPRTLGISSLCPSISSHIRPFIIGLAGGIGSGKSTVSKYLQSTYHIHIIDCDVLGHSIYAIDTEGYRQVIAAFGSEIINPVDRSIDRKKLGPIVFTDPKQLARLNDIVWPLILERIKESITTIATSHPSTPTKQTIVVVEAAILIEAGWNQYVDETWVVQVAPSVSIDRVVARNPHLTPSDVSSRLSTQMSNDERASHANVVIYNDYSLQNTHIMIQQEWKTLYKRYGWKWEQQQLEAGADKQITAAV